MRKDGEISVDGNTVSVRTDGTFAFPDGKLLIPKKEKSLRKRLTHAFKRVAAPLLGAVLAAALPYPSLEDGTVFALLKASYLSRTEKERIALREFVDDAIVFSTEDMVEGLSVPAVSFNRLCDNLEGTKYKATCEGDVEALIHARNNFKNDPVNWDVKGLPPYRTICDEVRILDFFGSGEECRNAFSQINALGRVLKKLKGEVDVIIEEEFDSAKGMSFEDLRAAYMKPSETVVKGVEIPDIRDDLCEPLEKSELHDECITRLTEAQKLREEVINLDRAEINLSYNTLSSRCSKENSSDLVRACVVAFRGLLDFERILNRKNNEIRFNLD